MAQTVIGIFDNAGEAQAAVAELTRNGFNRNNIDVSDRRNADVAATGTVLDTHEEEDTDSIGEFFRNLFGSDKDKHEHYAEVARRGSIVTVHAQSADEAERAADILDNHGAIDIDEHATKYQAGAGMGAAATGQAMGAAATDKNLDVTGTDRTKSIPIIEENLQVGKREVQTGGVRIRSRIVERPVEERLRLREEHVWAERRPVNRPATEADLNSFKEGEMEMTERAEVPVVNKEARVVEEVNLGKKVEEREESIKDTVRKTDVDIEKLTPEEERNRLRNTDRPGPGGPGPDRPGNV
ncbi:YsnF/AvaK domain-containing protein [Pontibacter liquoris]|uniref:YsnF/AvaK domain-containing protein n=1 Tax=Pontibacter liquoris TaxID=2905677 RepID=UPI001FA75B44|nr:YsnF/AvaK domain-containing protein [Pontibacter liquoris]